MMTGQELAELDLAVALATGVKIINGAPAVWGGTSPDATIWGPYQPSTDPAEAMRLLEKYRMSLDPGGDDGWNAGRMDPESFEIRGAFGPTPAIAICRAVVALHAARSAP